LLVVGAVGDAWARSRGGRYGGSSGFGRSRPAFPGGGGGFGRRDWAGSRDSRGYARGYGRDRGGYGPRVFLPPVLFFGGGGGAGPVALLIVLGMGAFIAFVIANDLRSRWRIGAHARSGYAVVTLQLALFATARFLQDELADLARRSRTDTPEGLAALLRETAVALARKPEYWKYARVDVQHPSGLDETEAAFHQAASAERAKLSEELIVRVDGRAVDRPWVPEASEGLGEVPAYLVITLIVAVSASHFDELRHPRQGDLELLLIKLGSIPATRLLAFEMIWSPADARDALTEEELLVEYTNLEPL
jgi:uncharacterized membrane protein